MLSRILGVVLVLRLIICYIRIILNCRIVGMVGTVDRRVPVQTAWLDEDAEKANDPIGGGDG